MLQNKFGLAFWVVLVVIACRAVWLARSRRWNLFSTWWITTVVATFSICTMGFALYIGYVAPLSIMQDIVAAQQGLQGRPLPSRNLKPYIKAALEEETVPPWLMTFWPRLAKEGQEEYNTVPDRISEQAHPPFMTLFVAPFVYLLGIHGTFLVMASVSIGFLGVTFILLDRGLHFKLRLNQKLLIIFVFLSWCPMYWVLRGGQTGAVLSGLVVISWYCIRQGRPVWGGIALGIATSLKVFPGLLLVYFLLRHRRAMMSAVATIVALNLLTMVFWGAKSYEVWIQTSQFLFVKYGGVTMNYSLLGALHRLSEGLGLSLLGGSKVVFSVLSLVTVSVLCWTVIVNRMKDSLTARYDLEYSLFVGAMLLLSPIVWFHYFVLLLLPLAVLAKVAMNEKTSVWSVSLLLAIFLILAVPPPLIDRLLTMIQNISWRLSLLVLLFPTLAVIGIVSWIAKLIYTSELPQV